MSHEYGPQTPFGQYVFQMKYAQPNETPRDVYNRVASKLKNSPEHYHAFRDIIGRQRFLPAGRNLASLGTSKNVCSHNCFVSGTIEDSFVDGHGSIMDRAKEAATTMRMGGGIGYDFSTLRPRGDRIKKLDSNATGPVSFMHIFDAIGLATCSSGHRRGAQMGVLRVDHPDIQEFVHAKTNGHALTGFNISVAVTDEFMRAVESDSEFPLRFGGQTYRTIRAGELWESIMRNAWDWGEPGILFIDRINNENNLQYCEDIAATNPCSEQPLPAYGACLLGSFNLTQYITGGYGQWTGRGFNYDLFRSDIATVVDAMDNVNDVAKYPLEEQYYEAQAKRRMGLGVTGLANALEAMGHPYGSPGFLNEMHHILRTLRDEAYYASAMLAKALSPFRVFDADKYLSTPFIQRLPARVRDAIAYHGIRNSHLISIAPTGTISLAADNVSSGIEPVFAVRAIRKMHTPDRGLVDIEVLDYGKRVWDVNPVTADQVTADQHIQVLATAQAYCDSAVSKTCNVDGRMPWDGFKDIYMRAWRLGAKGCTVFNSDGLRGAVLTKADVKEDKPAEEDLSDCVGGSCSI